MSTLMTVAALLVGIIVLTPVADRVRVPQPVLLTLFGLLLALFPGMAVLEFHPDLVLPVVLPPLLFAATQRTTVREFTDNAKPVLLLAVGLTIATAAVVAVVAHTAGLAWGPAWVLGAVVSPPDPVAATAVARRLKLPQRLVTVLEGEGMFNDATALVLYKVTVVAVVAGALSPGQLVTELILAIVVGVGSGLALAWLTRAALSALHDAGSELTVIALMPFVVYLVTEHLDGSGVLAVLTFGLFLRSYGHRALSSSGYLLGRAVWSYADFLITSLVFALIGFELTKVLKDTGTDPSSLSVAALVVGTVIVFRAVWMFPAAGLAGYRRRRQQRESPYNWQETTVAAWAGMRGVVTVATALALPATATAGRSFPDRNEIIFVALVCVLVTLVLQGLTLSPLVSWLRVGRDTNFGDEVAELKSKATAAALMALRGDQTGLSDPIRAAAISQYEAYLTVREALQDVRAQAGDSEHYTESDLRSALDYAAEVEREVILRARRTGDFSAAAADQVLDEVEARSLRDLG